MKLWFCIGVLILASCAPIKRHARLVKKYPFVHTVDSVTIVDTFTVIVPETKVDTVVKLETLRDTVTITKDRLKVKLFTVHDSVYIEGSCDTVTVEKIVERKIPVKYYEKNSFPWAWLLTIAGIILLIVILLKYDQSKPGQR